MKILWIFVIGLLMIKILPATENATGNITVTGDGQRINERIDKRLVFFCDFHTSDALDEISGSTGTVTNGSYEANDKGGISFRQDGTYASIKWTTLTADCTSQRGAATYVCRFKTYVTDPTVGEGYLFGSDFSPGAFNGLRFPLIGATHTFDAVYNSTAATAYWNQNQAGWGLVADGNYHLVGFSYYLGTVRMFYDDDKYRTKVETSMNWQELKRTINVYCNVYPGWYTGYYNNWAIDFVGIYNYAFTPEDWDTFQFWAADRTD